MSKTELTIEDDSRNGEQIDEWVTTVDGTEYECLTEIFYAHFDGHDNLDELEWQLSSTIVSENALHSDAIRPYLNSRLREYDDLDKHGGSHRTDDGRVEYTFMFTTTDMEYVRSITDDVVLVLDELFSEYGTSYEERRSFEEGDTLHISDVPEDDLSAPITLEWDDRQFEAEYDDTVVTFEWNEVEVVDVNEHE